ncbi:hypothetical protein [Bordetella flabilis]|uniref:Uncharacterized protein n=1 Tax=Bordetella flabilis TaxID=463014 RepID=A0A193GIS2_9BORD|nr:hypothetical protein [Bordetella flabilis]ANN79488.1 hypothetical protein BAU07_22300 [Bordetella flabilis]
MEEKSQTQQDIGNISISVPVRSYIVDAAIDYFGSQQWQVQLGSMADQAWVNWYNKGRHENPSGSDS